MLLIISGYYRNMFSHYALSLLLQCIVQSTQAVFEENALPCQAMAEENIIPP